MGTKKTMMILCCALVMVFAMSTCAFAGYGQGSPSSGIDKSYNTDNSWSQDGNRVDNRVDNSNNSTNIDKDICLIGIDYTKVDVATTLNNANNSGIILQGSDSNIIVAVDDICLDLCVLTSYSGNAFSFNQTYCNVGNVTYNNVGNEFTATSTINTNWNSFNELKVDLNNVGNSSRKADFNYTDNSVDVDFNKSFNGNNLVEYNDNDCFDYDDNDGIDADIFASLNLWGWGR